MRIRVLLFGPAARKLGTASVDLPFENPPTIAAIRTTLLTEQPAVRNELIAGRFAVNQRYVDDAAIVGEGDEIALISMVSGG